MKSDVNGPGFFLSFWRAYSNASLLDFRNPAGFLALVLFALILAVLYHYALDAGVFLNAPNLNGTILAALYFLASMAPGRAADLEREGGARGVMVLAPADPFGFFFGRVAALWQKLALCLVLLVPAYYILLAGVWPRGFSLARSGLFLAFAALSLAALGVLLGQIAVGNRLKNFLMPLLLFPATLPVFIFAAGGFRLESGGLEIGSALLACAGLYCGLGALLYAGMLAED